jgi:hypothetical protein
MQLRRPRRATAISAVLGVTALGVTALSTAPVTATAATPPSVIKVTLTDKAISFANGTSIPAGRVVFEAHAPKGHNHVLQLLRLHSGYPLLKAAHDIEAAFGGDLKAIHRVDTKIDWLGGAPALPGHPGRYEVRLDPGKYVAIDQDEHSQAATKFDVVDAPADYRTTYPSSVITTKHNDFHTHTGGLALPHASWLKFRNNAKEPHFLVFNHVKQSTTGKDVREYAASGSDSPPSWGLPDSTDVGIVSPGTSVDFKYNLPPGKYLLACFWPSIDNGMPHFSMGMWKLVELS